MHVMESEECSHFVFEMFNFEYFIEVRSAWWAHSVLRRKMAVNSLVVFSCIGQIVHKIFERDSMRFVFMRYKAVLKSPGEYDSLVLHLKYPF
jgi:hypothetical protein